MIKIYTIICTMSLFSVIRGGGWSNNNVSHWGGVPCWLCLFNNFIHSCHWNSFVNRGHCSSLSCDRVNVQFRCGDGIESICTGVYVIEPVLVGSVSVLVGL